MTRLSFFTCLALGMTGLSSRAEEPEVTLEKAKKMHSESIEKARNALLDAFAMAMKIATGSGNLDVVKSLQAEKDAFESAGKLPTSARMKSASLSYQLALKHANVLLEKAYEQAVKDLTKGGKLAQADAVQTELKEFRSKALGAVRTKEDLRRILSGTSWVWGEGLKLKPDGYVEQKDWQSGGLVTKWEAVDRRTVVLWIEKGRNENRYAILMFSEDLTDFQCFDFNGKDRITVKRKP